MRYLGTGRCRRDMVSQLAGIGWIWDASGLRPETICNVARTGTFNFCRHFMSTGTAFNLLLTFSTLPPPCSTMQIICLFFRFIPTTPTQTPTQAAGTREAEMGWPNERNYNKFMFCPNAINSVEFLIWFCHLRSINPPHYLAYHIDDALVLRHFALISTRE